MLRLNCLAFRGFSDFCFWIPWSLWFFKVPPGSFLCLNHLLVQGSRLRQRAGSSPHLISTSRVVRRRTASICSGLNRCQVRLVHFLHLCSFTELAFPEFEDVVPWKCDHLLRKLESFYRFTILKPLHRHRRSGCILKDAKSSESSETRIINLQNVSEMSWKSQDIVEFTTRITPFCLFRPPSSQCSCLPH